jgi:hypothetical protein
MSEPRWLDYKRGRQVGRKPGIRAMLPIGLAFVALALTGCQLPLMNNDQGITDPVWVTNNTHVPLRFTIITPYGKPFDLGQVPAGGTVPLLTGSQLGPGAGLMVDRCTVGDLIAYDPSGREVARHPPPFCARDKWTIGDPLGSSEPSG